MTDVPNLGDFLPADAIAFPIMKVGTDQSTGWILQLAGPGHPQSVKWANEQSQRALSTARTQEQQRLNGKRVQLEEKTPEDQRRENVGWVCSRIVGWNPVLIPFIDPAAPTEYTPENALKVFTNPNMGWALNQVVEALVDDATFMKRSATV